MLEVVIIAKVAEDELDKTIAALLESCPALFREFMRQCSTDEANALVIMLERSMPLAQFIAMTSSLFALKAEALNVISIEDEVVSLAQGMEICLRDMERNAFEKLASGQSVNPLYMC